ncbi:unnamed protein product, partial [Discosporangium mesarthrocarpum]
RYVGVPRVGVRWHSVSSVLSSRGIIEIRGADAKGLLQGLITNDMGILDEDEGPRSISTAFLTPKGRVLGDALLVKSPQHEAKGKPTYKLRSKAKIKDVTSQFDVMVTGIRDPWGKGGRGAGREVGLGEEGMPIASYADPRCADLGVRLIRPRAESCMGGAEWLGGVTEELVVEEGRFDALRMLFGVAEGQELVGSIPLEFNLEFLGSVSFTKGCYVGQELTARTHFKGLVRKRVLPVMLTPPSGGGGDGGVSPPATTLTMGSYLERGGDLPLREQGDRGSSLGGGGGGSRGVTQQAEVGLSVVDVANKSVKMGSLVAVSPDYGVGLALLKLESLLLPANGSRQTDLRLETPPVTGDPQES